MVEPGTFVVIAVAVLLGSAVQSIVGLGMGLVAAPVVTLLEPDLMPGTMIMVALLLPAVTLVHDHEEINWPDLMWSLPTRAVGTGVGVWVVVAFTDRQLGIAVGVVVFVAVLLTWRTVVVPVTRGTLASAGFVSGITGTATSIGGPPFALLYQHRPAQQIRTTMAVYFIIGAALSLVGLTLSGDLTQDQVGYAAWLLPAVVLGVVVGSLSRRVLPAERVRPLVLIVSAASALVLLARALTG